MSYNQNWNNTPPQYNQGAGNYQGGSGGPPPSYNPHSQSGGAHYGGQVHGGFPPQGYGGGPPSGVDPQVYQWFQTVDADRSGQINATELRQALVNGNWSHFNEETCRLMIGMFDRDGNGQINLHEFQALWNYIQQWKGVFEKYDSDRSGFIESQELHRAWHEMGYRLSPQFIQLIIRRFDRHGRGGVTLDGFIQACVQLHGLTESFKSRDQQRSGTIRVSYEDFLIMVLMNKV